MESKKRVIQGDYYELGANGTYSRHSKVQVHCYQQGQQNSSSTPVELEKQQKQRSTMEECKDSPHRISIQPSQFRLHFEEEERPGPLQSVPEQKLENSGQQNLSKDRNSKRNFKLDLRRTEEGKNLSRSTHHDVSPKKGILKRSLLDQNQTIHERLSPLATQKFQSVSFSSDKIANELDNQRGEGIQRRKQVKQQYQNILKKLRRVSSEIEEDHLMQYPSTDLNPQSQRKNQHSTLYSPTRSTQILSGRQAIRRNQTTNGRKSKDRRKTDGIETVIPFRDERKESKISANSNEQGSAFCSLFEHVEEIWERVGSLQKQMELSEERVYNFYLQRQIRAKQIEIKHMVIKQQSIKKSKAEKEKFEAENNSHEQMADPQKLYQETKKLLETKIYVFLPILFVFLLILVLGKPGSCSR